MEKSIENITFIELWEEYDKFLRIKLKSQSYRKENSCYKLHILPYFGHIKVVDITHSVYLNWMSEIEQLKFKYSYKSSLHGYMVSILNYAIKFYGLKENIASKFGNFNKLKSEHTKIDFWTYEEFEKFISVVDDEIYKTFYETMYFTGLRLGECIALNWNDFENGYIEVNKTICKEKDEFNNYIFNSPKTSKSYRKIKLDNMLINSLNNLYLKQQKQVGFSKDWFIFGGKKPLSQSTIGRRKDQYCKKANVKKIRMHDFRHSHATLLLSSGVPITVISQRLGHSDIATTLNIYSHFCYKDENKAISNINNLRTKNI